MEDGIWFFDESCPGGAVWCLKMALSNGPDKPFTEQDVVSGPTITVWQPQVLEREANTTGDTGRNGSSTGTGWR